MNRREELLQKARQDPAAFVQERIELEEQLQQQICALTTQVIIERRNQHESVARPACAPSHLRQGREILKGQPQRISGLERSDKIEDT